MDTKKITRVVFVALLLDIIAFTIILPLFPRLVNYYVESEKHIEHPTFLRQTFEILRRFRKSTSADFEVAKANSKWDSVLLGGTLGSLFSFCQFIASPTIGSLSDKYGRRRIILLTMLGNILSCIVWMFANSFGLFILSRIIGGLSEGNVQLSISIISDITTAETRSRGLAFVGIAFAIAFTFGPALGAAFAKADFSNSNGNLSKYGLQKYNLHPYSVPALFTLCLLLIETAFLYVALPETLPQRIQDQKVKVKESTSNASEIPPLGPEFGSKSSLPSPSKKELLIALRKLSNIHLIYLFLFSGMEFTLTFLTFDILDYTNMQNGRLLGYIGVLSALIQGGYVRRRAQSLGEHKIVQQGFFICAAGLFFISSIPYAMARRNSSVANIPSILLYVGGTCLAFASATVVNCLTSLGTMLCDDDVHNQAHGIARGHAMGKFRSHGQLGRCLGPLFACSIYWTFGPSVCYMAGSTGLFILFLSVRPILLNASRLKMATKKSQ